MTIAFLMTSPTKTEGHSHAEGEKNLELFKKDTESSSDGAQE